jgi:hypothetical protein
VIIFFWIDTLPVVKGLKTIVNFRSTFEYYSLKITKMKITRKIKLFTCSIVFFILIYQLILRGSYLNSLIEKLWYLIFYRYYQFEEIDYSVDDTNAKYVVYECVDFCGGWADRLKGMSFRFEVN